MCKVCGIASHTLVVSPRAGVSKNSTGLSTIRHPLKIPRVRLVPFESWHTSRSGLGHVQPLPSPRDLCFWGRVVFHSPPGTCKWMLDNGSLSCPLCPLQCEFTPDSLPPAVWSGLFAGYRLFKISSTRPSTQWAIANQRTSPAASRWSADPWVESGRRKASDRKDRGHRINGSFRNTTAPLRKNKAHWD